MRIAKQLAKEFWLPLVLAVVWTTYNFYDAEPTAWDVRKILNTFGPTFFFMTWIVAQWFRVRKQLKMEEGIVEIRNSVKSLNQPLLPSIFIVTLKQRIKPSISKQLSRIPEKYNLISGVEFANLLKLTPSTDNKFRMQIPNGFIDIKDGKPISAGAYSLDHPGLNTIEGSAQRKFIKLNQEDINKLLSEEILNNEIFEPPHTFTVSFEKHKGKVSKSLMLKNSGQLPHPIGCVIMDNAIYTDFVFTANQVENPSDEDWSFLDLHDGIITATFGHLLINGLNSNDETYIRESKLHNFQWIAGEGRRRILWFSNEMLTEQSWVDPEYPLAPPSKMIELRLTRKITDDEFKKQSIHLS